MAKKYVPSGYQIINLGDITKVDGETIINKGENADADILIDLYVREKLLDKPILLKAHETSDDNTYIGWCNITGGVLIVGNFNDDMTGAYGIAIYPGEEKLIIYYPHKDF